MPSSSMPAPANLKRTYRFGLFEADLASGELLRQGIRVRLQDLPFRLLTILLERPGEVVSREELRQKLWPADTYVEFDGSLSAALKRLRAALADSADNPIFIETVPKRGYRFLAPVAANGTMHEEPPEVLAARTVIDEPAPTNPIPIPLEALSHSRPRWLIASGVLVLILFSVGLSWFRFHRAQPVSPASTAAVPSLPVRKSIAILGFRNVSGRAQDDWLSTAFSEMLSTELATGERLRLIPGEEVANVRLAAPWPQTTSLSRETTARIRTALNSDVLVLGSYTIIGKPNRGQLRLDVTLQDARTGDVVSQIAEAANTDDLFSITSEVGSRLRESLGVPGISDAEQAGVLASLPLNHDAARFYALGVTKLREFDAGAAKDLLEQAVAADPKFSLAHAMLAHAWNQLGYEQKRKEEAKRALDLSTDLPRAERLQVEGDYYDSLPDFEKAASLYRALFELFPDSVEYGLQLAYAESSAGHKIQGVQTLARLRRLPSAASEDPRIDIAQSWIHTETQAESLNLLHSAENKASSLGLKLVYAKARAQECMTIAYGDQPQQADAACADAYSIYRAAGNNLGAADALRLMADRQGSQGHIPQAIATYQRALKILQGHGEHLKTAVILNNMAICFTNEGNLDQGEQLFRQAMFHFEQGGDRSNAAVALVNVADIFYLRGNLLEAAKTYQRVIEICASLEKNNPGYALYRLADVRLAQGSVPEAHRLAQQALDVFRSKSADTADATSEFGAILEAEGDLPGARQHYQAAMEIRRAQGRTLDVAGSQASLGELALQEGHPDQAENLLRSAIAEFDAEKIAPESAQGYTDLSRALLQEGKLEDARNALQHASENSRSSIDPAMKLPLAIQNARIEAAPHDVRDHPDFATARQQLRSVITSARQLGYYQIECDARLALAEIELKANPSTGRSLAKELAADAGIHRLQLIAREANALVENGSEIAAAAKK